jgi:hypothetical protein
MRPLLTPIRPKPERIPGRHSDGISGGAHRVIFAATPVHLDQLGEDQGVELDQVLIA